MNPLIYMRQDELCIKTDDGFNAYQLSQSELINLAADITKAIATNEQHRAKIRSRICKPS